MQRDEEDLPPEKPKRPCLVCGELTDIRPVCERFQLCLWHLGEWLECPRYQGGDLATNAALTPAWLAEKRAERTKGAA